MTMNAHQRTAGEQNSDPSGCRDESDLIGAGVRAFFDKPHRERGESGGARSREIARIFEEPPVGPAIGPRPHHSRGYLAYAGASIAAGLALGFLSGPSVGVKNAPDSAVQSAASVTQALPWKTELVSEASEKQRVAQLLTETHALRTQIKQIRRAADNLQAPERLRALEAARDAKLQSAKEGADAIMRIERLEARIGQLERTAADRTPTGSVSKIERSTATRANEDKRAGQMLVESSPRIAHPKAAIAGYVLRDVFRGIALVESRDGVIEEVARGDLLPGAGRVTAIARRGGAWVVVTTQGVIGQRAY
jgi:hypothetical protein